MAYGEPIRESLPSGQCFSGLAWDIRLQPTSQTEVLANGLFGHAWNDNIYVSEGKVLDPINQNELSIDRWTVALDRWDFI